MRGLVGHQTRPSCLGVFACGSGLDPPERRAAGSARCSCRPRSWWPRSVAQRSTLSTVEQIMPRPRADAAAWGVFSPQARHSSGGHREDETCTLQPARTCGHDSMRTTQAGRGEQGVGVVRCGAGPPARARGMHNKSAGALWTEERGQLQHGAPRVREPALTASAQQSEAGLREVAVRGWPTRWRPRDSWPRPSACAAP